MADNNVGKKILDEASRINLSDYYVAGRSLQEFINAVQSVNISDAQDRALYDRMRTDATIGTIIDMYVSDALVKDVAKNRMCWPEVETTEDDSGFTLQRELEYFLYEQINIEETLPAIASRLFSYGASPLRLGYSTKLEDEQNSLFHESDNFSKLKYSEAKEITLKEVCKAIEDDNKLFESFRHNKSKKTKELKESGEVLKEERLVFIDQGIEGRWYTELLPASQSLCELRIKNKPVAYIDSDINNTMVLDAKTIVPFIHNTDTSSKTLYSYDDEGNVNIYTVAQGESYLKNARQAYQVLSAFEDLLLMHALTTAINYRIFSVEVGNMDTAKTEGLLSELKTRIRNNEAIDLEKTIYSSSLQGLPLGDSIFVPIRNGLGSIKVDTIQNTFGIKDLADFDYFRNKLATSLGVPSSLLGFSADQPSGIGAGSSLTRQDIRYSRRVESLQNELAINLEKLCDIYLKLTRTERQYKKLPRFSIKFAKIDSADEAAALDAETTRMSAFDKVIETFDNIGIKLNEYKNTRSELLRQFFSQSVINAITKDESEGSMPEEVDGVDSTDVDIEMTEPSGDVPPSIGGGEDTESTGLSMEPSINLEEPSE